MTLESFKKEFDEKFLTYIQTQSEDTASLVQNPFIKQFILSLIEHAQGGKRLRPYVTYLAYKTEGGKADIDYILFAIELLHLFALVHDDIIDHGDIRHNKPTLHKAIADIYSESHAKISPTDLGNAQAILLGDILYQWSYIAFEQGIEHMSLLEKIHLRKIYNTLIQEVIVGEMLDVHLTSQDTATNKDIEEKTLLKTALYSFARPMMIGAVLAGKNNNSIDMYEVFGTHIGMAFQIGDDIIDIFSSSTVLGKEQCKDITERQHTILSQYIHTNAPIDVQNTYNDFFGKHISLNETKILQDILTEQGAYNFALEKMKGYLQTAYYEIDTYTCDTTYKNLWKTLLQTIEHRTS